MQQQNTNNTNEIKMLKQQNINTQKKHEEEIKNLEIQKKGLENSLKSLQNLLDIEKTNVINITEQKNTLKDNLHSLNKQYAEIKLEIELINKNNINTKEMLGKEAQFLLEQLKCEQRKYAETLNLLNEETENKKNLEILLNESKQNNVSLQQSISSLNQQIFSLQNDFNLKVDFCNQLEIKLDDSQQSFRDLECKFSNLEISKETLVKDFTQNYQKLEKSKKNEITSLQQKIVISEKTILMLEEEKKFLENNCLNLKQNIERLNDNNNNLKIKVEDLQKTITSNQNNYNNKIKSLQKEISSFNNNLNESISRSNHLNIKISSLQNEIKEKNLIIIDESNKNSSLKSQIKNIESKFLSLDSDYKKLENDLDNKKLQNISLKIEMEDKDKLIQQLKETSLLLSKKNEKTKIFSFIICLFIIFLSIFIKIFL